MLVVASYRNKTSRTNLGLGTSATQNSGVFAQVANNLSDVTAATARTNLAISSTAEADAKYVHLNTDKAPTADGAVTLGTGVKRFKEIYAVAFKGNADTATTATNLAGFTPANYVAVAGGDTMTGTLTLSGVPTNALHAATKGYVDTTVANLIDSSPGALNTLNELAAAIGDDANFSTTITNSIATKLPLAGGTLTGALVLSGAPTIALHAATKAYADAVGLGLIPKQNCKAATTDLLNASYVNGTGGVDATLTSSASEALETSSLKKISP